MKSHENPDSSLVRTAGRGAAWQIAGGGWHAFLRLAASAVLSRLLTPADFGIVSMAIIAREFIRHIGNLGMGAGIIAKKELTQDDLNVCFWSLSGASLLLVVIAFYGAPLVGNFFNTTEVINVLRVLAFAFIFDFIRMVPVILLQKELRFRPIIIINSIALLLELTLVILLVVIYEYNYWALIYGMLFNSILITFLVYIYYRWLPGFSMNYESFKYFMRYGIYLQFSSIVNFLHHHLDYIVIGYLLGTVQLGYYQFATKIPDLFKQRIAMPIAAVIFPTISRYQDHNDQLMSGYSKSIRYISLGIFPSLGGIAVLANEIVIVLWGAKWIPVVLPLQFFCLCAAIRCIMTPVGSIFNSKQRPDLLFKTNFMQLGITFICTFGLGYKFGLNGAAFGMMLAQFFSLVALKIMTNLVGSKLTTFLLNMKQAFVTTSLMVVLIIFLKNIMLNFKFSSITILLICTLCGLITYVLALRFIFTPLYNDIMDTTQEVIGERTMSKVRGFVKNYI